MGITRLKATFLNLAKLIYRRIFLEEMSAEVETFLKSLFVVAIGIAIATLFSTAFTIMGGRILGPEEYGKFTLVQTIASFLCIPMYLGFTTALIKYSSERSDADRQSKIISTAFALVFLCTLISVAAFIIFGSQLARLFSSSSNLFFISLIIAVMIVFFTITTSILRSLDKTHAYAFFQVLYAAIMLIAFLVFILNRSSSFKSMAYPMIIAYGISSTAILIFSIHKTIKWNFDRYWAKILTKYSAFSLIGGLAFVFYSNFDNLMVNKFLNVTDLGIYNAYSSASINVMGIFTGVFFIVFFPTVSKYESKGIIFKRINKFMPYLIFLGIPLILVCEFIVLKLYGNKYPLNTVWLIIFPIASVCVAIDGLYGWLLNSVGLQGVRISSFAAIILVLVNVGLNIILIPRIGITGAVVSIIVSYNSSVMTTILLGKKYFST